MCDDHDGRVRYSTPLQEVSPVPGVQKYRASMAQVIKRLGDWQNKTGVFYEALRQIQPLLIQAADRDGNLREDAERSTRNAIDRIVSRIFVGEDGRHAYGADGVTALAPFPHLLNELYVQVVVEAVVAQRDWMRRNVPADVFRWLATTNSRTNLTSPPAPLSIGEGEHTPDHTAIWEQLTDDEIAALRIFHPNPLMELDPSRQWVPMHKWNDPNGYQLSDRVWRTGNETRREIDRIIAQGFREGTGAVALSQALEAFLIPGQEGVRTMRPYGVFGMQPGGASAWALRLARTEIARAANHAAYTSAYLNPYVNQVDVARSSNGYRKIHNCTDLATIGFGGERLREPYSIHSAMLPPWHPNCMCSVRPVVADNPDEVTRRLRAMIAREREALPPAVTPAQAGALTQMLLHQALNTIIGQFTGQLRLPGF